MENDFMMTFDSQDSLRWRRLPEEVEQGECFKETSKGIGKLSYYKGKFSMESQRKVCIIREFIAEGPEVYRKAENELYYMNHLLNIPVVGIFGFVLEPLPDSQNLVKYTLVTQSYERSLANSVNEDANIKLNLLFQLVQHLYLLKQKKISHGGLRPEFIYVDENHQIVFGDLFWMYACHSADSAAEYLSLLDLLEDTFLAPEIIILKNNKNCQIEKIDFIAADTFSVGLLILYLFKVYSSYNLIKGNAQDNLDFIYHKKSRRSVANFPVQYIFIKNYLLRNVVEDCLRYGYSSRFAYKNILPCLALLIREHDADEYEVPNNLCESVEFKNLLEDFESLLQYLHERKDPLLTISYIKVVVGWHLEKFKKTLEEYHRAYLSTKCRIESANLYEGIGYFICELYFNLKNSAYTESFRDAILNKQGQPHYKFLINHLFQLDETLQDYVISGLISQNYKRDWKYFFPLKINEIKYNSYTRLRDLKTLYKEFRAFIMHPYVKVKLSKFLPVGFYLDDIIDNLALDRVYILEMQPSLYGLTTCSGNIFLSDFESDLNSLVPENKVCILLTLIHQLAQLLRRINCNNFNEMRNKITPTDNEGSELHLGGDQTESEIYRNRGDTWETIEQMILGESIRYINREAAIYLLKKDFRNPQFREILKRKCMSKYSG